MANCYEPFWKTKSLAEMTQKEWESLCDGCGRCCLLKLEDKDAGKVYYINVSCHLFDTESCRCTSYEQRTQLVTNCIVLNPAKLEQFYWLPLNCVYRRLFEGMELQWWHPLVSGDPNTVHEAGISIRGKAISEQYVHPDQIEDYIIFQD